MLCSRTLVKSRLFRKLGFSHVFVKLQGIHLRRPEPVFVNLFRSPGIDSRPGGTIRQPCLTYRPASLHSHRLAESISWNFLEQLLNDIYIAFHSLFFHWKRVSADLLLSCWELDSTNWRKNRKKHPWCCCSPDKRSRHNGEHCQKKSRENGKLLAKNFAFVML